MKIILLLIISSFILQALDYGYYKVNLNYIKCQTTIRDLRRQLAFLGHKKLDNLFTLFPFVWSYLLITAAILLSAKIDNNIINIAIMMFVTGRFRTLQEAGHFAVHGVLSKNIKYGLFVANIFYQFPAFMPESSLRRETHVRQHHNSVNMPHDPDLKELTDKGFFPGITIFEFWCGVFYPLTTKGIKNRIIECFFNIFTNRNNVNFFIRIFVVIAIIALFMHYHLYKQLILFYIIPVFVTYPLFYWMAHISLHRWFEDCSTNIDYDDRELILGRPTEFSGVVGFFVRNNIFPLGDSYHLAHSLFPTVRWTHLPQVDKILKIHFPEYSKNINYGLFFSSKHEKSIIQSLKLTLTKNIPNS